MSAGMAATSGTQHAPGAQLGGQLPQSIGVAHGGGHYASNGQRSGYGGGSGGSGPPRFAGALRQNGGLAPMMAVPEGYMSAMPAHAAMGGVPGYPPLQLPYALLPGQGMPAMQARALCSAEHDLLVLRRCHDAPVRDWQTALGRSSAQPRGTQAA